MKKVVFFATLLGMMLSPIMKANAAIEKKHNKHHHMEHHAHHVKSGKQRRTKKTRTISGPYHQVGRASWYGYESGNKTANGERFNPKLFTAAHRYLKLPTRVRVTNLDNHRSVEVKVNDRGPFVRGRIIDLSMAAAKAIGLKGVGMVDVVSIE